MEPTDDNLIGSSIRILENRLRSLPEVFDYQGKKEEIIDIYNQVDELSSEKVREYLVSDFMHWLRPERENYIGNEARFPDSDTEAFFMKLKLAGVDLNKVNHLSDIGRLERSVPELEDPDNNHKYEIVESIYKNKFGELCLELGIEDIEEFFKVRGKEPDEIFNYFLNEEMEELIAYPDLRGILFELKLCVKALIKEI